jgi:hypothetical protein
VMSRAPSNTVTPVGRACSSEREEQAGTSARQTAATSRRDGSTAAY